jgi:hypothetical protein
VSTEPENQRHTEQYESRPYDAPECDRPGLAAYQPEVINKQSAYDYENGKQKPTYHLIILNLVTTLN